MKISIKRHLIWKPFFQKKNRNLKNRYKFVMLMLLLNLNISTVRYYWQDSVDISILPASYNRNLSWQNEDTRRTINKLIRQTQIYWSKRWRYTSLVFYDTFCHLHSEQVNLKTWCVNEPLDLVKAPPSLVVRYTVSTVNAKIKLLEGVLMLYVLLYHFISP